jgi:tetratricopeptide (TPR) repeat protein
MICAPATVEKVIAYPENTLFEGVGSTDLPITTKHAQAKMLMQQGFALIHCFWFDEAVRSFRDATKLDPGCGTAWLGLNVALTQPWTYRPAYKDEALYAIQRAVQHSEGLSEIEQELIAAYRRRSIDQDDRGTDFETAMEAIIKKFPKFNEPRLMWAGIRCQLCMHTSYMPTGDVRGDLQKVMSLIEPVLKRDPKNAGALHYHIHALEPRSPQKAVKSAELIGKIAHRSSHMVHMAGHIFNRVGRYEDAHKAFSRAKEIELEDARILQVTPMNVNWNHGHNRSFMAVNLAEMGRMEEALKECQGIFWTEPTVRWRAGAWADWLAMNSRAAEGTSSIELYMRGMDALAKGETAKARELADQLTPRYEERKARPLSQLRTPDRMTMTMALELLGAVQFAEGKPELGEKTLREAIAAYHLLEYDEPVQYARPPYETLGHCLIAAGRAKDAEKVFREGLKDRPNSYWLLKGIESARASAKGD